MLNFDQGQSQLILLLVLLILLLTGNCDDKPKPGIEGPADATAAPVVLEAELDLRARD